MTQIDISAGNIFDVGEICRQIGKFSSALELSVAPGQDFKALNAFTYDHLVESGAYIVTLLWSKPLHGITRDVVYAAPYRDRKVCLSNRIRFEADTLSRFTNKGFEPSVSRMAHEVSMRAHNAGTLPPYARAALAEILKDSTQEVVARELAAQAPAQPRQMHVTMAQKLKLAGGADILPG